MSKNNFEFEQVESCVLCNSTDQYDAKGVSWQGVAFSYCICGKCGLKYMRPRPTQKTFEIFYKEQYWQENLQAEGFATVTEYGDKEQDQLELRMPKYKAVYAKIKEDICATMRLTKDSRVMEVGCAFGFSLEWLKRDFGCQVFGIEPSEESIKRCEKGGVSIIARTAEEYFFDVKEVPESEKYDVIYFSHALCTIADPVGILKGLREYLKQNGLLLIYTINANYYDAMLPFNPFLYTPETITRLLAKCGFDVFQMRATPPSIDHETAVQITNPSYECVVFAKLGKPRELPLTKINPYQIAKQQEIGTQAMAWSKLRTKDMVKRIILKSKQKLIK
jgi:SAM-dependent methyltransferase